MPFVRSFIGYRPPRRYDSLPFTSALIKESATQAGSYSTLETKTLSPVDSDPSDPASRDFTTALATFDSAWYKITWRDAALATFDSEPVFFGESSTDLTSVDAVRAYLQKEAASDAQDSIIASLITFASRAIGLYTSREFTPTSSTVRKFSYTPNTLGLLDLAPYDLRSATLLRIDSDTTSPSTLASTDYQLEPRTPLDGVHTQLYFRDDLVVGTGVGFRTREVEITGEWGFASVPADVEYWCIVQVAMWLRRDVAAFEATFQLDEDRLERPQALASAVRAGVAPYRRAP